MKKTFILAILLAFTFSPLLASAQAIDANLTPESRAAVVADIEKKINDLMVQILLAKIAELQAQVSELLAKQAETQTAVVDLGSRVEVIQTQTAPVLGASVPQLTATIGNQICEEKFYYTYPDSGVSKKNSYEPKHYSMHYPILINGEKVTSGSISYLDYPHQNNLPQTHLPKEKRTVTFGDAFSLGYENDHSNNVGQTYDIVGTVSYPKGEATINESVTITSCRQ